MSKYRVLSGRLAGFAPGEIIEIHDESPINARALVRSGHIEPWTPPRKKKKTDDADDVGESDDD